MGSRLRGALLFALLGFATLLYFLQSLPIALTDATGNPSEFSISRARATLDRITRTPHPVGSTEHEAIFEYLRSQLQELGLAVSEQPSTAALRMAGSEQSGGIRNLLGIIPGNRPTLPAVLLTAHYDSAENSRGAADDGTAVAALLEAARALKAGPRLARSVYILFSDAEELGLLGALAFVSEHPLSRRVGFVVNFEARGSRGPELLYQTSAHNGQLIDTFSRSARYPHANSLISRLSQVLPNDADTSIYVRAGYPVLGFAFAEGLEHYHQYSDGPENLDMRSLAHAGSIALDLARNAAQLPDLPAPAADAVYFDLFGRTLVHYPTPWARLFGTLVALGWVALLRREFCAKRATVSGLLRGAKLQLFCVGVAIVVPLMLWLLRALIVDPAIALRNSPAYGWGDFLVVTALFLLFYSRSLRELSPRDLVLGGLSLGAALSLVLGWAVPDSSAPWQWVTALAVIAWRFVPALNTRHPNLATALQHLPLALALLLFGPILMTAVAVAGPSLMPLPIVIAASVASLFLPTLLQNGIARAYLVATTLGCLGFAWMLAITFHAYARPPKAHSSPIVYAYDRATHTARFATEAMGSHPGIEALIPATSPAKPFQGFMHSLEAWQQVSAPVYPMLPATVTAREASPTASHRLFELRIEGDPSVRCVRIWQTAGAGVTTQNVNGKPVEQFVRFSPRLDELGMQLMSGQFSAHVWNLHYCGFRREPLQVRLQAPKVPGVKLRLVEERESLPEPVLEKLRTLPMLNPSEAKLGSTWIAQNIEL